MINYTKQIEDYLRLEQEVLSNVKADDISNVMNVFHAEIMVY